MDETVILYSFKCSYLEVVNYHTCIDKPDKLFGCYNKFNICPFINIIDFKIRSIYMYCVSTSYDIKMLGTVTLNWVDYVRYKHLFIK